MIEKRLVQWYAAEASVDRPRDPNLPPVGG